jgi:hypothetical protein
MEPIIHLKWILMHHVTKTLFLAFYAQICLQSAAFAQANPNANECGSFNLTLNSICNIPLYSNGTKSAIVKSGLMPEVGFGGSILYSKKKFELEGYFQRYNITQKSSILIQSTTPHYDEVFFDEFMFNQFGVIAGHRFKINNALSVSVFGGIDVSYAPDLRWRNDLIGVVFPQYFNPLKNDTIIPVVTARMSFLSHSKVIFKTNAAVRFKYQLTERLSLSAGTNYIFMPLDFFTNERAYNITYYYYENADINNEVIQELKHSFNRVQAMIGLQYMLTPISKH